MTESSRFWTTDDVGDGIAAGFSQDHLYELFNKTLLKDNTIEGVLADIANELAVTGSTSPVAVNTGASWIRGLFYENTASVDVAVSTPAALTGGHIVLEADWAAQTVRVKNYQSGSGDTGIPALTQNEGTTWQIRLATYQITSGGAITLTDARSFMHFNTKVSLGMMDDDSVDTDQLVDDAVDADKLATDSVTADAIAANAVGSSEIATDAVDSAEIKANAVGSSEIATGAVGSSEIATGAVDSAELAANAVVAGKIANGAVDITAALANNIVDDTKVGNRVPMLTRRQGGHATQWNVPGTTGYTPTAVKIQVGSAHMPSADGSGNSSLNVTFPTAFSDKPIVLVSLNQGEYFGGVNAFVTNASQFNIRTYGHGAGETAEVHWIAIGAE